MLIIQSYVLNWYNRYLLHLEMVRKEAIIHQIFFCTGIRKCVQKEVNICHTYELTKKSNKKYGQIPAEEDEEILWNILLVWLIGHYMNREKGKKENSNLKAISMIDQRIPA